MSKRVYKRLQQKVAKGIQQDNEETEKVEVEVLEEKTIKKDNIYSNFFENDDDDDDDEDQQQQQEEENEEIKSKQTENQILENKTQDQKQQENKKEQKKRKKNKNAKKQEKKNEIQELNEKELDFKLELPQQEEIKLQPNCSKVPCLKLNPQLFNYQKELQHYFKGLKMSDQLAPLKKDKKQQAVQMLLKQKNRNNFSMKRCVLTNPQTNEYMQQLNRLQGSECFEVQPTEIDSFGYRVFTFSWTARYQVLQQQYQVIKNSGDPQGIFSFLQQYPWFVEAVYDIAEFYRLKGEYKEANKMIEQVIWRLEAMLGFEIKETLWGSRQDQGGVRVAAPEVLFLALHKFVDVLVKKSCFRAALEINKLLLKLDPVSDPVGALFCIDYVSICARDYKFFLTFANEFCNEVYKVEKYTLIYLPNIIYSCALIKYIMEQNEQQQETKKDEIQKYNWNILLNSSSNLLSSNSTETLKCAIIFYPQLLSLLIEKCEFNKKNEKLQETIQNWPLELDQIKISLFRETDFEKEQQMQLSSINRMCEIYVERCAQCWRWNSSPKLISWLSNAVGEIIQDLKDNQFQEIKITGQLNSLPFGIERYKGLIKSRFSPDEAQIDFNNIEDNMQMGQQPQQQQGQHVIDPNSGFFNAFLQSLLPWYQIPANNEQQQQQQDQNEDIPDEEWEDWEDFN